MQIIPTKVDGVSTLPASEFNQIPLEITNAITNAGITPSILDTNQLSKTFANNSAAGAYYVDSGGANAKVLSRAVGITTYAVGTRVRFINLVANTSGTVTVNVNGIGAVTLYAIDGAPLLPGSLQAGRMYEITYTGSAFTLYRDTRVVTTVNSSTNLTNAYVGSTLLVTTSSASVTISLPQLSTVDIGGEIEIILSSITHPYDVTVRGYAGTELIGTKTSQRYWSTGDSITFRNVAGKWFIVSEVASPPLIWAYGTDAAILNNTQTLVSLAGYNAPTNMTAWVDTVNERVYGLKAGYYYAVGTVDYDVNATGNRQALIGKNAGFSPYVVTSGATAPLGIVRTIMQVSGLFYLNGTTDYLRLNCWHNCGSTLNAKGDLFLIYLGEDH
ncbi:MAG: hypothetical protein IM547_01660 [Chitinophagaceae bacterium]|nr:hypothetical protein [Chitinophagaceae bacterium]